MEREQRVFTGRSSATRFALMVLLIALLGGGIRLGVIESTEICTPTSTDSVGCSSLGSDAAEYIAVARSLADGQGFKLYGAEAAHHPPAMSLYLSLWLRVGIDVDGLRRATALLGVLTIAMAAIAGRRIAGAGAGMISAAIVALHPALWINDVVLMAESVYQLMVVVTIWAAYRFWTVRSLASALLLGGAGGVAALARPEGLVLAPLLGSVLILGMVELRLRDRAGLLVAVGATLVLVLTPWVRLNATRFEHPVFMTTTAGQSLLLGNQPATYYGVHLGWKWGYDQLGVGSARAQLGTVDESTIDARLVEAAAPFRRDNVGRLPVVVLARMGRMWGVYRPEQSVQFDEVVEGRFHLPSRLSWYAHAVVAPLGIGGLIMLWRRRLPISPLVAPIFAATLIAGLNVGLTRYRAGADVSLALGAGVLVAAVAGSVRSRISKHRASTNRDARAQIISPQGFPPRSTSRTRLPSVR